MHFDDLMKKLAADWAAWSVPLRCAEFLRCAEGAEVKQFFEQHPSPHERNQKEAIESITAASSCATAAGQPGGLVETQSATSNAAKRWRPFHHAATMRWSEAMVRAEASLRGPSFC